MEHWMWHLTVFDRNIFMNEVAEQIFYIGTHQGFIIALTTTSCLSHCHTTFCSTWYCGSTVDGHVIRQCWFRTTFEIIIYFVPDLTLQLSNIWPFNSGSTVPVNLHINGRSEWRGAGAVADCSSTCVYVFCVYFCAYVCMILDLNHVLNCTFSWSSPINCIYIPLLCWVFFRKW